MPAPYSCGCLAWDTGLRVEDVVTVVERINHHLAACSRCQLVSRSTIAQRRLAFRDLSWPESVRPTLPRCGARTDDLEAGL